MFQQPNYTVPGGRISPSVSEADLRNPVDNMKGEVSCWMSTICATMMICGIKWTTVLIPQVLNQDNWRIYIYCQQDELVIHKLNFTDLAWYRYLRVVVPLS